MTTGLDDNAVVVFHGDSSTDCGRSRTDGSQLSGGYAGMVAARRIARAFHARYILLDGIFAAASAQREPEHWAGDGVQPSAAGHALIAQAWLRSVTAG